MIKTLNSKRLTNYLRKASNDDFFGLIPEGSRNIRVFNLEKLPEGITNALCSFSLAFIKGSSENCRALVLKGYIEKVTLWNRTDLRIGDNRSCVREFQVLRSLRKIGFPVPKVYFCEKDPSFLGYPFIVMEKLKVIPAIPNTPGLFASILGQLHNLKVEELGIKSLSFPKDGFEFATNWTIRFRRILDTNRHLTKFSKIFGLAEHWIEHNAENAYCPRYSLLHGDYHLGNLLFTKDSEPKVIDWENVEIGDPAYDVAYAYHMLKITGADEKKSLCGQNAEQFVSEYLKDGHRDVGQRLEFYKVVSSLALAISVSFPEFNPLTAYRHNGFKAFPEFPILLFPIGLRKLLKPSFSTKVMQYCEDYFEGILDKRALAEMNR